MVVIMHKKQIRNWVICEAYAKGHEAKYLAQALGYSLMKVVAILVREGVYTKEQRKLVRPKVAMMDINGF